MTQALAAVLAVALLGAPARAESSPACAIAATADRWCDVCGVGHLAGLTVRSEMVFEALDAHGHPLDPAWSDCPSCVAGIADDGYCDEHARGYSEGEAFLSRLTYEIARGKRLDVSTLACATCRENSRRHGWCAEHAQGMIGNVAIRNRTAYDHAARGLALLKQAEAKVASCELCAAAIVADGRCPQHRMSYKGGTAIPDR